jgi:hypothetical protein
MFSVCLAHLSVLLIALEPLGLEKLSDGEPTSQGRASVPLCTVPFPCFVLNTVDSRLSARGLTALRLNRGNVVLKKKFYFP